VIRCVTPVSSMADILAYDGRHGGFARPTNSRGDLGAKRISVEATNLLEREDQLYGFDIIYIKMI
jgi:hypothetical protein